MIRQLPETVTAQVTGEIPFQGRQPETGQVHVAHSRRFVETCRNGLDLGRIRRRSPLWNRIWRPL